MKFFRRWPLTVFCWLIGCLILIGCGGDAEVPEVEDGGTPDNMGIGEIEYSTDDVVSLWQSTLEWETYAYELDDDGGIVAGSFDGETTMTHTFGTWVLENETIQATLVPEFGGRIISLIYKPTGHEQLYQNPLGVPYLIGEEIFYYDWLMIYGGIFPTFPEPEHGKTWFLPWEFTVIEESEQEVTVAMSFVDDMDSPLAPKQYDVGVTGLEVTFYVTLKAGRSALDTQIELHNPTEQAVRYEYWTNVGLAPGSVPGETRVTAAAEIIAPIDAVSIPNWSTAIAAQEDAADLGGYTFTALRQYENWPDMGIAYAYPNMGRENFWGVINHENEEGLFRIGNNDVTEGLKIWTFGYPQSVDLDPYGTTDFNRPMIELWAGISPEFWMRESFPADGTIVIEETYAPTVRLHNVTHANRNVVANVWVEGDVLQGQVMSLHEDGMLQVKFDDAVTDVDSEGAFSLPFSDGEGIGLEVLNEAGELLIAINVDE